MVLQHEGMVLQLEFLDFLRFISIFGIELYDFLW